MPGYHHRGKIAEKNLISSRIIHFGKGIGCQGAGDHLTDGNNQRQLDGIQIIGKKIYSCPYLFIIGPSEHFRYPFDGIFENLPVIFQG